MSAKRKLIVSLFSIVFVVFAVVTTFSVVYALTEQEINTLIDMEYNVEDIDGYVEATYTVGNDTKYLTPVGGNIDGNKLIFTVTDTNNAGHFEFPNEIITLTEENDSLIIKYSYSNTGDKHYIASMDFESQFNKNNMIVEYGIIDSSTGVVNYSTNRYAVFVPANSTNKEYYIKVSIDDKTNYASFTASINWILQGCDPQSVEYLTYENLDIQGSDGVYTASYTGGYVHTGELIYPTEINGSPVTTVASNENITSAQKSYIKKVVIPDSVTAIANNAFNGFNHLEEIVFGEEDVVGAQSVSTSSLTTIGEYAFANCERLDELTLPNAVTSVGKNVFENCYNLKQMTLPEGVTDLADAMFKNCSSLTNIEISENIESIPIELCSGCTELINFKFPKRIFSVGANAFKNCSRLVGKVDLACAEIIGESAFENCSSLSEVVIGGNIEILGTNTFAHCKNVEKFYILSPDSITALSDVNVFSNISENCKIYVIPTLLNDYATDENWSIYADRFDNVPFTTNGECIDSLEAPVLGMRIYGNSVQNGTPTTEAPIEIESVGEKTKNILDISKIVNGTILVNNNDKTYSLMKIGSSRFTDMYDISIPANTTLTISLNQEEYNGTHGYSFNVALYTSDGTAEYVAFLFTDKYKTYTVTKDVVGIKFYIQSNNPDSVELKFKDLMIELNDKVTAYEPYGYKIEISQYDKNAKNKFDYSTLLNANKIEILDETIGEFRWKSTTGIPATYINAKENTQHFISFKAKTASVQTAILVVYYTDGSTQSISKACSNTEFTIIQGVSNANKTIDYVKFGGSGGLSTGSIFKELQIEEGVAATNYEQYIGKTSYIYLNEPLRKVGDVADYIDLKTGKVVRNIERCNLGDLNYRYYAPGDTYPIDRYPYGFFVVSNKNSSWIKGIKSVICDCYNFGNFKVDKSIFGNTSDKNLYIIDSSYSGDADAIKEALTGYNVYVQLATPTEETIDIPEINTIAGGTTFEVLTSIQPSQIMVKYHK